MDILKNTDGSLTIDGRRYELTFSDDFDGRHLDQTKWSYCPRWPRQNAGGWWDAGKVELDGKGNLIIKADLAEDGTPLSGGIRSIDTFRQARGYFECRTKVQHAPGLWTAFWLMCPENHNPGNGNPLGAEDGAEIDIYESFDLKGGISHAVHCDGYGPDLKSWGMHSNHPEVYDDNYHTFGLLWTDKAYIFFVDGKESGRLTEGDPKWPGSCKVPCYMKVTCEFGTWSGPIDPATLPDTAMVVDYVRAWKA